MIFQFFILPKAEGRHILSRIILSWFSIRNIRHIIKTILIPALISYAGRAKHGGFINENTRLSPRALGRSVSGQRGSALDCILHADAWFQYGSAKFACFRSGFNWEFQTYSQRSWSLGFSTDARWPSARAWWMDLIHTE